MLTAVPTTPGKVAYPPPRLVPSTRPCLLACVPSAMWTRLPDTRWIDSTQSPAAHTPSASNTRICRSVTMPPHRPSGSPAAAASDVSGSTPVPRTTRSVSTVPESVTTARAHPSAPVSKASIAAPVRTSMSIASIASCT